jgi:hypothetical protein
MLNAKEAKIFSQKLRDGLTLIHEAFAMLGEMEPEDENTVMDAVDNLEQVAQELSGTYGLDDD